MDPSWIRHLLATGVVAAFACVSANAQGQSIFRPGEPLPHLELPTIDGERTIDLADLKGKKVLLIQFASW